MNIGFFDPISERWIKPRPEKEPEPPVAMSLGEALLAATEAKATEERNAKIWEYLKQSAEGCNDVPMASESAPIVTEAPPEYQPVPMPEYVMCVDPAKPEPEYEAVESLGYVYWRKKAS